MQKQIFPDNAFRLKNSKSNFNSKFAGQKNELKEHFLRKKKKRRFYIRNSRLNKQGNEWTQDYFIKRESKMKNKIFSISNFVFESNLK